MSDNPLITLLAVEHYLNDLECPISQVGEIFDMSETQVRQIHNETIQRSKP